MSAADGDESAEPAEHEGHVLTALRFKIASSSRLWMASTCNKHSEHHTWCRDLQFMTACQLLGLPLQMSLHSGACVHARISNRALAPAKLRHLNSRDLTSLDVMTTHVTPTGLLCKASLCAGEQLTQLMQQIYVGPCDL